MKKKNTQKTQILVTRNLNKNYTHKKLPVYKFHTSTKSIYYVWDNICSNSTCEKTFTLLHSLLYISSQTAEE